MILEVHVSLKHSLTYGTSESLTGILVMNSFHVSFQGSWVNIFSTQFTSFFASCSTAILSSCHHGAVIASISILSLVLHTSIVIIVLISVGGHHHAVLHLLGPVIV